MAVAWITAADLANPADPLAAEAIESASWVLYNLSGQKYPGIRTTTEWYGFDHSTCWCDATVDLSLRAHGIVPVRRDYIPMTQLRLRNKPVQSVTSVTDSTGVLDPTSYHLVNDAYLLRLNGGGWDFYSGVEVEYTYGTLPPMMGRSAAIRLANEFLLSYNNIDECRLPDRVTSLNRQGASLTILDPQEFLKEGRTGLYEVDLFLAVANPSGAKKRAKVFSPDKPRGERRR